MILNQIHEMMYHVRDILDYVHVVSFAHDTMSLAVGSRLYGFSQSQCHIESKKYSVCSYTFNFSDSALSITVKTFDGTFVNVVLEKLEDN